jgi:hypothetical protein
MTAQPVSYIDFYDSTEPALIPADAGYAALYYDGDYGAAGREGASRFPHVRWITVIGDYENCGIADYEPGNPVYINDGALRAWVEGRNRMDARARVYCDRDVLPQARDLLTGLDYLVWVSTLDGNQLEPDWTEGLWAVQYNGGENADYDESVLYMPW